MENIIELIKIKVDPDEFVDILEISIEDLLEYFEDKIENQFDYLKED